MTDETEAGRREAAALATALPEAPPALAGLELLGASMTVAAVLLGLTPYEFALWATGRGRFTAAQAVLLGLYLDHVIDEQAARLAAGGFAPEIADALADQLAVARRTLADQLALNAGVSDEDWQAAAAASARKIGRSEAARWRARPRLVRQRQPRPQHRRARELLAAPPSDSQADDPHAVDAGERPSLAQPCPCCGARMIVIDTFEPGSPPRAPPNGDGRS